MRHLFEIREIVEPAAAALAAERGNREEIARMAVAYEDMAAAGDDIEAGIEPDLRFHQSILAATENELLRSLGSMIETALAASFKASRSLETVLQNSLPLHKKVLEAISEGDSDTARDTMHILLDEARDGVIGMFHENGD